MDARHGGSFFDEFLGDAPVADRYNIDDTNGTVALVTDGPDKVDGVLRLAAGPDLGDFVLIYTDPEAFTRWGRARFFARFRVPKIDSVYIELGFRFDLNNYVVLKVDTDTDFDWHFEANAGGVTSTQDYGGHIDTDWHTVEIRLLGGGGAAELVLDADESNKLTIADANLPDKAFFPWAYCYLLYDYSATLQTRDLLLDYWGAHQQTDPAQLAPITAPGGGDAVTAMTNYAGALHVGRGSDAGGAKARYVQRLEADGTWTDLGAPSATAGMVRALCNFDGEIYAGLDDEPEVYEWTSGTTWASIGAPLGADGIASMVFWQDAALSSYLYAGSIENSPSVYYWNGGTTWVDFGDAGWPAAGNGAITLAVHDGKLWAYLTYNGRVYSCDPSTFNWTDHAAPGGTSPSTVPDRVLASFKGNLYAFDPETAKVYRWGGGTSWTAVLDLSGRPSFRAVNADGLLYFLERTTEVLRRSVDGDDWKTVADLSALNAPSQITVADGVIFVGDDSGIVRALR